MVALNEQFHHNGRAPRLRVTGDRLQGALSAQCSDHSSLAALGSTAAGTYSNGGQAGNIPNETTDTLIFTGPGTDGIWFTDDDVQSSYGANEIIYCGYRYDPETELYYVRARTYNPTLGRWLQRDPIGYAGGIGLYEYGGDNSLVHLDPDGMQVEEPPGVGPLESLNTFKELLEAALGIATIYVCQKAHDRCEDDMLGCGDAYNCSSDPMYQALTLACGLVSGNVKINQLTPAQDNLLNRLLHHQIPNKPPCCNS